MLGLAMVCSDTLTRTPTKAFKWKVGMARLEQLSLQVDSLNLREFGLARVWTCEIWGLRARGLGVLGLRVWEACAIAQLGLARVGTCEYIYYNAVDIEKKAPIKWTRLFEPERIYIGKKKQKQRRHCT